MIRTIPTLHRVRKMVAPKSKQRGSALLFTVLMLLITLTVLTMTATNISIISTSISSNVRDKNRSILAADSATRYAWQELKIDDSLPQFVQNGMHSGYYDLRDAANPSLKDKNDWNVLQTPATWAWDDANTHDSMPNKISFDAHLAFVNDKNNPMQLFASPQYVKGINEPVLRHGSESAYCIPVSIVGAGQGGSEKTRSMVEIKVIPRKECFRSLVK